MPMDLFETHTTRNDSLLWDHEPLAPQTHGGLILPSASVSNLSGDIGKLSFQELRSPDGYSMWANFYGMKHTSTFVTEAASSAFELNVMLRNVADHMLFNHIHQSIAAQQYNLFFLPYIKNDITLYGGQSYETIDYHFEFSYFERLFSRNPDIIGPMLDAAHGNKGISFLPHATFLNRGLRCLNGYILELITHKIFNTHVLDMAVELLLVAILDSLNPKKAGLVISPEDEIRIIEAREQLLRDLGQFTSIAELAKIGQMNTTKFKVLFKTIYSLPAKQYWNEYRMNWALELLVHSKKSIKDISLELGFHDQSSFSRAFSSKFGITPIEVVRRTK